MSTMTIAEHERVRHYLKMLAAKIRLERANTHSNVTSIKVLRAYDEVLTEIEALERATSNQIVCLLQPASYLNSETSISEDTPQT